MAFAIKIKRSAVADKIPTTSDLALGELAMNTNDGKLFMKKSVSGVDTIVDIGLSGAPLSTITSTKITATGGQTSFSVTYTPGLVLVFVNGFKIPPSDYTATNGTSVVMATGAVTGAEYEFIVFSAFTLTDAVSVYGGNVVGPLNVPTQAVDDNSTLVANTAWYMGQGSNATPVDVNGSSAAVGTSQRWARGDHTHKLTLTAINAALTGASSNVSVNGSVTATSFVNTTANAGIELGAVGSANTPFVDFHSSANSNDFDVRLVASGGAAGAGNGALTCTAAGGFTCSGNVTAYSDERYKTNWRGFGPNFIAKLAQVKVGIYDRKDYHGTQVGVSAQSLREVMPNAVSENDQGILSVAYGNAALAAAIELAKEVQALKAEVKALRDEINKNKDDLK